MRAVHDTAGLREEANRVPAGEASTAGTAGNEETLADNEEAFTNEEDAYGDEEATDVPLVPGSAGNSYGDTSLHTAVPVRERPGLCSL